MSLNMISNGNYSIYGGQWMNYKSCKTKPLKLMSECPNLISISRVRSSLQSHQASGSFSLQGAPFAHLLATSSHRNLTPITPTNLSPKRHSTISPKASKDATQPTLENASNLVATQQYRHLWDQCENCYGLNYKQFLKKKLHVCEHCGHHLKMSSSDRIELLIDPGTWSPLDETMVSVDPIEFDSEDEPYKSRIDSYQRKTGLTEGVQTGTGKLNGIAVAIGVMDFQFMGGSMGSVVGEKLTRLVEHAAKEFLPLIIVCASGGARMQEGSLSLMQMAKISCALHDYQSNKKLFYVPILTSPTTGGVTASFATLGDIIIAEPNAYIAFAGKRVIEQTLNKTLPEGAQGAENLFQKGLFDLIVPRNMLKGVLSELLQLHTFFPFDQN